MVKKGPTGPVRRFQHTQESGTVKDMSDSEKSSQAVLQETLVYSRNSMNFR